MAKIETIWLGGLRSEITHTQSGTRIMTDAPTDNHGKGEYFSPTDLVASALGSCMMTIVDIFASERGIDVSGTRLVTEKIMAADPRRIGEIKVDIYFSKPIDARYEAAIERAARTCPVGMSLHPDVKQSVTFHFVK